MLIQHLHRFRQNLSPTALKIIMNLWPPFLGTGIKIETISDDFRHVEVSLTLRWYNQNYVGTHFGGSIYALADPFFMLILIKNLGPDYIVWDKAAYIDFKKPGLSKICANFILSEEQITDIRRKADDNEKYIFDLPVDVIDQEGEIVASITKTLYVRNKAK